MQIGLTRVLPLAHDSAVAVAAGSGEVVDAEDRDGGRATPSDAPSAPELRLSRRLERSRGRRTRRWRYAPSRFDFSDAPPVLGERGGQRSCSSLVFQPEVQFEPVRTAGRRVTLGDAALGAGNDSDNFLTKRR